LFKNIKIKEAASLQFRAEAFNALNHISYGNPGSSVSSPASFGVVASARSTERRVQLAVKVLF